MTKITKRNLEALQKDLEGKITKDDYEERIIKYFDLEGDSRLEFMPQTKVDISFIFVSRLNQLLSAKGKQEYWGVGAKEIAQQITK